jgi:hypothetical protein
VSKYLSAIRVAEAPNVTQDAPDDLQDTPDVPQETPYGLQEAPNVLQETPDGLQETLDDQQENVNDMKMAKLSWKDLPFDADVNNQLLEHFCKRSSDKDPSKPLRSALLQLLLKYMVTSGDLIFDVINEEGVPILRRGDATHLAGDVTADVTLAPERKMHSIFESQSQPPHMTFESQLQPCHGQTPTQLAQAGVKVANMALDKATRTAQERSQEEAQEVERRKQEVTVDSKKLKKEARYKASVDNLGRLLACPRLCRGEECTGTPCREEEQGFPYSHIADMVVCTDKAHVSMATKAGCLMFHHWPKRLPRAPPAGAPKNSGGGTSGGETSAQGKPPRNATQERGRGPRARNSPEGSSSNSSSSSATWTTGG